MKKVFKQELIALEKYQLVGEDETLSLEELRNCYNNLLKSYRLLLQDTIKITAIGDLNQKKLYEAFGELEKQKAILYQTSITDYLTQVYNRSHIMKAFEELFTQGQYHDQVFSCILLDIDNFKTINDIYGHLVGDEVLKATAQEISSQLRKTDMVGRYGGEEFLLVLPNTSLKDAHLVAEKIRLAVENLEIGRDHIQVTVSIGVCDNYICSPVSQKAMLHKVDLALYEAKNSGKNRVIVWQ